MLVVINCPSGDVNGCKRRRGLRGVLLRWMRFVYAGSCNGKVAKVKMHVEKMQNGKLNRMAKGLAAQAPWQPPLGCGEVPS